jgi:protein SCO1/2
MTSRPLIRLAVGALAVASGCMLQTVASAHGGHASLGALDRAVVTAAPAPALDFVPLKSADGARFDAQRLRGHWTLLFFGFTSCPDVCPMTLQVLANFAHAADSGVASGKTQIVFVSVDPERDSPARLAQYVRNFDSHIVGVTGRAADLAAFAQKAGAGYASEDGHVDHSTSVFVIDPQGHVRGTLLHPADVPSVRTGFDSLRR